MIEKIKSIFHKDIKNKGIVNVYQLNVYDIVGSPGFNGVHFIENKSVLRSEKIKKILSKI